MPTVHTMHYMRHLGERDNTKGCYNLLLKDTKQQGSEFKCEQSTRQRGKKKGEVNSSLAQWVYGHEWMQEGY